MKIVVTDANILIDLCELGILEAFFALPYNMIVVESVWDELLEDQQRMYSNYMSGGLFTIIQQYEVDLMTVAEIKESRQQLSIPDCSSLVYAEQVKGVLLTSDKNLRTTERIRGVDVHGHLWMFDEMVRIRSLMLSDAIIKLTELRTVVNPKLGLPANECEIRLKTWGEQNR